MTPDQYTELCELYAAGALDGEEQLEFQRHLAGCTVCRAALEQAMELNETIWSSAPRATPSPQLRRRVLAPFAPPPKKPSPVLAWALAIAAGILVLTFAAAWNVERSKRLANENELARLRQVEQILAAPGTREVDFGPQPSAPHGHVFVHQKLGILLIADGLAAPPAGWMYESWVIPKGGSPIPVDAFSAPDGRGVSLLHTALPADQLAAVAVSLEPVNTPITKPTKVVFAAPLG